jgi:hypothetical protein
MAKPEALKVVGKSNPLTVITVMRPWLIWVTRLILWAVKKTGYNLDVVQSLRFIHFAQWTELKPEYFARSAPDQPNEKVRRTYFVFTTNFNGPWDQYIDTFSLVPGMRNGIFNLWLTSKGFPRAWPVRPFKRYIHYNEYPIDAYYNAYPDASIRDIEIALKLKAKADLLQEASETRPEELPELIREFARESVPLLSSTSRHRAAPRRDSAGPAGLQQ